MFLILALGVSLAGAAPPNMVFILADDLGCYGQKLIQTPNIDCMTADRMKFTHFYAGGSVSSSQAVLMDGWRKAIRTGSATTPIDLYALATMARLSPSRTLCSYRNHPIGGRHAMNRKEFLKLYAGIVGGLSIPGVLGESASAAETASVKGIALDESYLVKGLTAMVRASTWFPAHWGAGILAGYYLCRDNALGEETTLGIQKQLDAAIASQPEQFAPLPDEPADKALIEEVPKALLPAMQGGLRAHGHAVIFASLSIKAMGDAPHMARPSFIKALCGLSRQIAKHAPQRPTGSETSYADTQTMIDALFDSLARFEPLLGRPSIRRPNFTHMVTHTEALMNLEMMGYADLARAGHPGHHAHIGAPVPAIDPSLPPAAENVSLETVMSKDYWADPKNQERWNHKFAIPNNPNGDWIASGHLFKVLYSYHRLIGRVKDKEKVKLCSQILLERYINPDVQGG